MTRDGRGEHTLGEQVGLGHEPAPRRCWCGPVVASVGAAVGLSASCYPAPGRSRRAALAVLAVLLVVSTLTLVVVDRLGRRLLPVVTLLDLSMLFPDRAPSRLAVAREAVRRRPIEEQLARVRDAGADPGAVAREILTLVAAMRAHDRPTRGHAERVRMFTDLVAEQLHVPRRDRDLLRWAAILHDIGKLRVPSTLLNKPGKPTEEEWVLLKAHPQHGAEIAAGLLPWLGEWAEVVVSHHERYDGTGYPIGLRGRGIRLRRPDRRSRRRLRRDDRRPGLQAAGLPRRRLGGAGAVLRHPVRPGGRARHGRRSARPGCAALRVWSPGWPTCRWSRGSVPAATLARVVGAGALATGAVTGTAAVLPAPTPPPPVELGSRSAARFRHARDRSPAGERPGIADGHRRPDRRTGALSCRPATRPRRARRTTCRAPRPPPARPQTPQRRRRLRPAGRRRRPSPRRRRAAARAGPARAGQRHRRDGRQRTGGTGGRLTDTVTSVTDGVGSVVGTVTGTVGGVVADPTGTVDQTLTTRSER